MRPSVARSETPPPAGQLTAARRRAANRRSSPPDGLEASRWVVGDETVLLVEFFDCAWMDDGACTARLPQEDFFQALGVPPRRKYEQDGGPGVARCLHLLAGSADQQQDTMAF